MSTAQRVGQLFMVAAAPDRVDGAAVNVIVDQHVGSVLLLGESTLSVSATARITAGLQRQSADGARLFVAVDQEGGDVQRLRGPGFDRIPSALDQGSVSPVLLRQAAQGWGAELAAAGVNLDLAPVADTVVSPAFAPRNPPIGALDRQYGYDPTVVAAHVRAVVGGFGDAGVAATVKHFPGLGRVTRNTDTSVGVTDTQTTRTDPNLKPFRAAVRDGVPFVMMSTAVYTRIDANHPAAYSPAVIDLLRTGLSFGGVIITDDVGDAAQVQSIPVPDRAVDFIAAGGDMVLTVVPSQIPRMVDAVLARIRTDPSFAAKVDAAALRVLEAKSRYGLLR